MGWLLLGEGPSSPPDTLDSVTMFSDLLRQDRDLRAHGRAAARRLDVPAAVPTGDRGSGPLAELGDVRPDRAAARMAAHVRGRARFDRRPAGGLVPFEERLEPSGSGGFSLALPHGRVPHQWRSAQRSTSAQLLGRGSPLPRRWGWFLADTAGVTGGCEARYKGTKVI
jgi:hypothetical protein